MDDLGGAGISEVSEDDSGWPGPLAEDDGPKLSEFDAVWLEQCFRVYAVPSCLRDNIFEISGAARDFAKAVLQYAPPSADRSAALRAIRQAQMWADTAVITGGKF